MAGASRDLQVNFIGDTTKLSKGFGRLGTAFKGLVAGVAAKQLFDFGASAISAASDLDESMSKVEQVFGSNADVIKKWSQNSATEFGQSQAQALEAAGTFGNLFKAMGLGAQPTQEMSTGLVELASDLASFNNISPEEALEKLRSGLVGEIEPLRSLGVNFNAATVEAKAMELGLVGANGEITEAAKAQARYALIMEQTTTAQGDFARTSDGVANRQRILKARFADLVAQIGQRLLPIAEKLFTFLEDAMGVVTAAIDGDWKQAWKLFKDMVVGAWQKIQPSLKVLWDTVIFPWIKSLPGLALKGLGNLGTFLLDKGKELLNSLWAGMQTLWDTTILPWIKSLPGLALRGLGNLGSFLLAKGEQLVNSLWQGIQNVWDETLLPFFESIPGRLRDGIGNVANTLKVKGASLLSGFWNGMQNLWGNIRDRFVSFGRTVVGWIGDLATTIRNKGAALLSGFWSGMTDLWGSIRSRFVTFGGTIIEWVGDLSDKLFVKGSQILRGFWGGMADNWRLVFDRFKGLGSTIAEWVGDLAGTLYMKGWDLIGGLFDGVSDLWTLVSGWFAELGGRILSAVGSLGGVLFDAGKAVIQGLWDGMVAVWRGVSDWLGGIADTIADIKGPPAVDAKILTDNGRLVMEGFQRGLTDGWEATVVPTLGDMTQALPSAMGAGSAGGGGDIHIGTLALPNVRNAKEFVRDLRQYQRRNGPLPLTVR